MAKRGKKGRLRTVLDYITTGVVFYIAGVTLHEFFHYRVADILGYEATVKYPTWVSGLVELVEPVGSVPNLHLFLIGISGGALTCLFFVLVSMFTADTQTDVALGLFAPVHGFYSIFEVLYLFDLIPIIVTGIAPVLAVPFFLYVLKKNV